MERCLSVAAGTTVLEAARQGGIAIEGACGGAMACGTCHVHIDPGWFGRLPAASAEEEDMLDLAIGWCLTSRLGCQLRLTDELDGLTMTVPASTLIGG